MYITVNNEKGDSVMRKLLVVLVSIGTALIFSSCSTLRPPEAPSGEFNAEDEQELRTAATAYVTDALNGLESGSYELFIRNFAPEYRKTMTSAKFKLMTEEFRKNNGKVEKIEWLGSLNQGIFKTALWKACFARSHASEAELIRSGKDPEKVSVPDTLIRLLLGKIDGQWKIFAIFVN